MRVKIDILQIIPTWLKINESLQLDVDLVQSAWAAFPGYPVTLAAKFLEFLAGHWFIAFLRK